MSTPRGPGRRTSASVDKTAERQSCEGSSGLASGGTQHHPPGRTWPGPHKGVGVRHGRAPRWRPAPTPAMTFAMRSGFRK